jgi:hypothetical protein
MAKMGLITKASSTGRGCFRNLVGFRCIIADTLILHLRLLLSYNNLNLSFMSSHFTPLLLSYDSNICTCFAFSTYPHTESEGEYSDMSSAPLLDYPGGICVVFGVIGVKTRIAFSAF